MYIYNMNIWVKCLCSLILKCVRDICLPPFWDARIHNVYGVAVNYIRTWDVHELHT